MDTAKSLHLTAPKLFKVVEIARAKTTTSTSQEFMKNKPPQTIVPFLWFNDNAEVAVKFYLSVFKNSRIIDILRCGEAGPGPKGSVLTIDFELEGQRFVALNGNQEHKFSLAISLLVNCNNQKELDTLWKKLSTGGEKIACGWLTDKFGVAWQICPTILLDYIKDKNPTKAKNVMQAMMKMQKLDINRLKQAYQKE
jgi:predicted 3-demethylubiquinone-9 3-methyltransferase (glyoxalase superfamily)